MTEQTDNATVSGDATENHDADTDNVAGDTEATVAPAATDEGVAQEVTPSDDERETFSRDYVEGLRQENGKYRQRAQRADELAHRLHRALVAADGRLQDPTDLEFSEDHLADADNMAAAIADLLARKPHLAARRPIGDIGQGATPSAGTVDLAAILRGQAG